MAICGKRNWLLGLLRVFSITGVLAHVIFCCENHALAQITPDGTLGDRSSIITPNVNIKGLPADRIDGGAIRGANLFHSFQEFNVGESQRAYFTNPTGISNILTRVTGSNISNILGTLGVDGGANLFFLNPNGILFGNNARLDVAGSFVASTANSFVFGNGLEFSATNSQTPSPLLTVNPSALLFNQIAAAPIQNNSVAPAGIDPAGFNAFGLRVGDGQSLLLVGGNVSMDGGQLNAYGGRVELGGLAAAGNVNLLFNEDNFSLKFPLNATRASVSLTNQARVYVEAAGGGNIAINARNLEILGGSGLSAGIAKGLGTPKIVAGDITLNATEEIKIAGSKSRIRNLVQPGAKGNGGNISIDSGDFSLSDGAQLEALTFGQGNGGNVTVTAKDAVYVADARITAEVAAGGVGKGGNIDINAATLTLRDMAQLVTATSGAYDTQPAGRGDAGNVNVKVTKEVDIADIVYTGNIFTATGIYSNLEIGTVGKGGNITIDAGSLKLRDGAQLSAVTRGRGNAGNVTVIAKDAVSLAGNAAILTQVDAGGVGKGGNIDINAASLSVQDGAQMITITSGAYYTQPAGKGDAGNVKVKVSGEVDIAGVKNVDIAGVKNSFSSAIFSYVDRGTEGNGGNIIIDAGSLKLRDGALLDARTYNDSKGGDIRVNANVFEATGGGQLTTTTSSNGRAGKITVNATDRVIISGSDPNYNHRVTKFPGSVGNIGANSGLFVSSTGSGITGDIEINSPEITLDNQGKLNAESASGNGGNINLNSNLLLLRRNSQISTNAGTDKLGGNGGNININSRFIVAVPNENSDISAKAFTGIGGRVDITTNGIFGILPQKRLTENSDITASSELGVSGEVTINSPDTDPSRGLIQLPSNLVDASQQIAQGCTPRRGKNASRFIATGRGGLPQSPNEPLRGRAVISGWVDLPPQATTIADKLSTVSMTKSSDRIVEAQGWIVDAKGDVILVAQSVQSSSIPSAMPCSQ
ncbi:S-layer family protein [Nostoc sp. CHAB 5836]|uniref:two-partner secretion domain-containing protein n=1 Tax=Nostoc sp. CHAB 5836 TaxID=2780404 RepID=UPI001E48658A|nr:S-layer family protein [Nostoc sp. CHAB 5836]MCC5614022.1 S-layer family protein [Nostoc sp. CHAB 5836]